MIKTPSISVKKHTISYFTNNQIVRSLFTINGNVFIFRRVGESAQPNAPFGKKNATSTPHVLNASELHAGIFIALNANN